MSEDDAVPLVKPVAPEEQQAESPPQDKFFLIYIIFLLQGVGCVFPWNAFVLAPDYFNNLYGSKTMVIISFVNNIPNVATLFLLMFVRPNLKWRVLLGYLVAWFILTIVPILALLRVEGTAGFAITLVAVAITATCTALMQGGVFGLAGLLPKHYMQAAVFGNGLSGIIVSVMRIVTKLTLYNPNDPTNPDNLRLSFCIYFIASSVIVAICAVLLIIVTRAKYVTYYMELAQKQPKQDQKKAAMLPVIGKVWYLGIYAAVTYLTGKTVYPGLVTIIPSVLGPNMQEWLPVILTFTYNLTTLMGASIPRCFIGFNSKNVGIPVFIRSLMIPLIILCLKPRIFQHDAFAIAFTAILGFTNGHLVTLVMMFGPQQVEPHEKEIASAFMTFCLIFGLFMGGNLGLMFGFLV